MDEDPWWMKLASVASLGQRATYNHARPDNRHLMCLGGTRQQLIKDIKNELEDKHQVAKETEHLSKENEHARWIWLKGPAGYGKSAVASTTAEMLNAWSASFFFKKDDEIQGNTHYFFPVICYQLVTRYPKTRCYVCEAIQQDPNLLKKEKPRRGQMKGLLYSVLACLYAETAVIFIDAIDECDPHDRKELLDLLTEAVGKYPTLRILLSSRPTAQMERLLGRRELRTTTISVQRYEATKDVFHLLENGLDEIHSHNGLLMPWKAEELMSVANSANSSFEVANAIVHHVKRSLDSTDAVSLMTNPSPFTLTTLTTPRKMDDIYRYILTAYFPMLAKANQNLKFFCIMANLVEPTTQDTLSLLFNRDIHVALDSLASLVFFSNEGVIRLHDSLRDFLSDRNRCGDEFYIEPTHINAVLAQRCCAIIEEELAGRLRPSARSSTMLHPSYPFRHWMTHYLRARPDESLCGQLESFIEKYFFEWIFAMSRSWHSSSSWTSASIRDMCRDFSQQTEELLCKYKTLSNMAKSRVNSFNDYVLGQRCSLSKVPGCVGFSETFDLQDETLPNVVVIGRRGSGVSSLINLICGHTVARTKCDSKPCTSFLTAYVVTIRGQQFQLIDAPAPNSGLPDEEPWIDVFAAIRNLHKQHSIGLLIHCVPGRRAKEDDNICHKISDGLGRNGVPIVLAVTHLGQWDSMEDWWKSAEKQHTAMNYVDHARISAHSHQLFKDKRDQSKEAVEKMIEAHCRKEKRHMAPDEVGANPAHKNPWLIVALFVIISPIVSVISLLLSNSRLLFSGT